VRRCGAAMRPASHPTTSFTRAFTTYYLALIVLSYSLAIASDFTDRDMDLEAQLDAPLASGASSHSLSVQ
jgi:hypothetical protein